METKIAGFIRKSSSGAGSLAAVALMVIFLAMFVEVVGRYFFNHPFNVSIDIGELMLIPLFYLPLAIVLIGGGHVVITTMTSHLPPLLRQSLAIISAILGLFWSALMTWQGCVIFWQETLARSTTMIAELPLYPFSIAIPIGAGLFFLGFILQLIQRVRGLILLRRGVSESQSSHMKGQRANGPPAILL